VFCAIPADADHDAITASIVKRVDEVKQYVPGYRLRAKPQYDAPRDTWNGMARVAVFLEVRGNGDYLPPWAGNLDIMTAAAQVGHDAQPPHMPVGAQTASPHHTEEAAVHP
jgi:acetaldehyde dehydrogenase